MPEQHVDSDVYERRKNMVKVSLIAGSALLLMFVANSIAKAVRSWL